MNREQLDKLTEKVIGLAIKVHKELGPGFVEKIYEKALAYEFHSEGIAFKEQYNIRFFKEPATSNKVTFQLAGLCVS